MPQLPLPKIRERKTYLKPTDGHYQVLHNGHEDSEKHILGRLLLILGKNLGTMQKAITND